jgi:uncharacterized NAD(P)/FAD-binding protein YdhS
MAAAHGLGLKRPSAIPESGTALGRESLESGNVEGILAKHRSLAKRSSGEPMRNASPTICVVGGGFTGVAGAVACLEHIKTPFRLVVVEPGLALGSGVAFGGHHPLHLLNVRTRDLTVRAGQPGDFLKWAFRQIDQGENHAGLHEGLGHTFLPRQLFGEYVRQRFFEGAERRPDVQVDIVKSKALALRPERRRYHLLLESAPAVDADAVLIATAYGLFSTPGAGALSPSAAIGRERLARAKSIALIGSGLSMVDVLLAARRDGFSGTATVLSRRGQLPRPHASKGLVPHEVALPRSKHLSLLTASVRLACEAAEMHGTSWQAVINGIRPQVKAIWQTLPVPEQARFLRHVRPYWDAYRHRLPMEVHASVLAEFASGRAQLLHARAIDVVRQVDSFRIAFRRRGSRTHEFLETELAFDCRGHAPDLCSPLIQDLLAQGLARADAHGLGLAVAPNGQVQDAAGCPRPSLFALGPLGQGSLWEITAVPEIVEQADQAARAVATSHAPAEEFAMG